MSEKVELFDCRDTWVEVLIDMARSDDRIIAVANDSIGSSKLGPFESEFPDRTINVGIAEQNMVGISAGLANGGKVPFVSCAGPFLTARAMEQIKVDVAYSGYNVKLIAQSPGVSYGELGPTHHSIEDLAWMRALPGLVVLCPADPKETEQVIRWAVDSGVPAYIRIARMGIPSVYSDDYEFAPGKAVVLREGSEVAIIATGTAVHRALGAADILSQEGCQARVLAMTSVKPLDEDAILAAASETAGIVTVEEGLVCGLGGAVAELLAERHPAPMRRIGFHDSFAVTGSTEWLFEQQGITAAGISAAARELL